MISCGSSLSSSVDERHGLRLPLDQECASIALVTRVNRFVTFKAGWPRSTSPSLPMRWENTAMPRTTQSRHSRRAEVWRATESSDLTPGGRCTKLVTPSEIGFSTTDFRCSAETTWQSYSDDSTTSDSTPTRSTASSGLTRMPHSSTFQSNRGLAEDGVAGPLVVRELTAITRGDPLAGRERVREREWVRGLPTSIAGTRLYIDPVGMPNEVGGPAWDLALAIARGMQEMGGVPVLSRSADISPPAPTRARRANRLGVHITISLQPALEEAPAVHYFESAHSRSEAGLLLAQDIATRIGIETAGRATAMLKHTRAPAVTVAADLDSMRPEDVVDGVCAFFEKARDALS